MGTTAIAFSRYLGKIYLVVQVTVMTRVKREAEVLAKLEDLAKRVSDLERKLSSKSEAPKPSKKTTAE
jgi:hypothetical protein